jgi:ABC-type antimicrobial peptide transport system permease subunit
VGGIWIVAGHGLRRRRLAALLIALLVGAVGAVVLAAVAGARRSSTAVERFNAFSRSSDLEIDVGNPTTAQIRAFARDAHSDVAVVNAYGISPDNRPNLAMGAPLDDALGDLVDRPRLIAGRLPNPNAPDEVTIGEALSAQERLPLGGYLDASSLTPAQLAAIQNGEGDEETVANHPEGPRLHLHVVGITRRPFDLSDRSASGGVVLLTPAFDRVYAGRVAVFTTVLRVRTPHAAVDRDDVAKLADERFGKSPVFSVSDAYAENRGAASAVNVVTIALWLFAALAALAGVVAATIVVARDVVQTSTDQSTLAAIGFTRRDRIGAVMPRALVIALSGAALAVVGAIALSPLFPVGIARRTDPDTGVHADWFALGLGGAAVIAVTLVVAGLTARRATRRASERAASLRSTRVAAMIGGSGLRPTTAIGVGMAVDSGRSERALPAATTCAAAIAGVLGVTAAVVFAASFGHLVATPKLFGWTWDFKAPDNSFTTPCGPEDFGLDHTEGVSDVAAICYEPVAVDGRNVVGWGFQHVRGTIDPTVVAGRAPRTRDEVALGTRTLDALHKRVGDRVRVSNRTGSHQYRVVGELVLPQIKDGDVQPLADGAAFTQSGMKPLTDDSATRYLVGRYAPGVDRARVEKAIAAIPEFGRQGGFLTDRVGNASVPPEIDRIRTVNWLPPTLGALTALLALIAVGQGLVSSVRRRRHEFAVLKALGFQPRQVEGTVAWQASTIAVVGIVLGIPLGILVGRLAWEVVADSLGIAAGPITPLLALAVLLPIAVLLVNLIGFVPGRAAARTSPAVALASE